MIYEFGLEGMHITDNQKFSDMILNDMVPMNQKLKDYNCSVEIVNPKKFNFIIT